MYVFCISPHHVYVWHYFQVVQLMKVHNLAKVEAPIPLCAGVRYMSNLVYKNTENEQHEHPHNNNMDKA
jgi:hypothetical protein